MQEIVTAAKRLIVAADFSPDELGIVGVKKKTIKLAEELSGLGVTIKVNSVLGACGYRLIHDLRGLGVSVFADLKLNDIDNTLAYYGDLLKDAKPEFLTVSCHVGVSAMKSIKAKLPDTKVLGVTVLTSLGDEESKAIYGCNAKDAVLRLARIAYDTEIDGLICSPYEVEMIREIFGSRFLLCTPGIRPSCSKVLNDDQARLTTPTQAIYAGADYIVAGRPITTAKDPREVTIKIIKEIETALPT